MKPIIAAVVFSLAAVSLVHAETIELVTYFPAPAAAGGGDQQMRSIRVGDAAYQAQPAPPVGVGLFQEAVGIGIPVPGGGAPTLPVGVVLGVQGAPGEADRVVFLPGAGGTLNVGIGTATPNEQLELTGNLRLAATNTTTGIIRSGPGNNLFIHRFGNDNFFAGINAGNLTMTGAGGNTGVGRSALQGNTTGQSNTAIGVLALQDNATGVNNTAVGAASLPRNTTGDDNTAVGARALQVNDIGSRNTAVGGSLVQNTRGNDNTAMGWGSLALSTFGDNNVALGSRALFDNTTGSNNTAVGRQAGASSIPDDVRTNITGSFNTFIGFNALPGSSILTNATAIGANALVSASNALVLGGTGDDAVNVGIGVEAPRTPAPGGGVTGNLDVNDIWVRALAQGNGRWLSGGARIQTDSYTGNGSDNRQISTTGVHPRVVVIVYGKDCDPKPYSTFFIKTEQMSGGSAYANDGARSTFETDLKLGIPTPSATDPGEYFTVGGVGRSECWSVNYNNTPYYWFAIGDD